MKCVVQWSRKFGLLKDTVQRVSDDEAAKLVATGGWAYYPKQVWKEQRS